MRGRADAQRRSKNRKTEGGKGSREKNKFIKKQFIEECECKLTAWDWFGEPSKHPNI